MFVKICGTTSEEDALLSVALGADAIGFIMAPSPRQVTAAHVSDIVKRLPTEVMTVGVFRGDDPQRIVEQVLTSGVRAVQLHGQESRKDIEFIRSKLPLTIIKALPAGSSQVSRADKYKADIIMLDAPSPGSGHTFDWTLVNELPAGQKLLIAGGLNADNVADAIRATHPWGVDAASGTEASPGRKDPRKLREFIKNAKAVGEAIANGEEPEIAEVEAIEAPKHRGGNAVFDWASEGEEN
jgi:phosphoribosylanthranilate isomerase